VDIDTWWDLIERARVAAGDRADDRDRPDDPLFRLVQDLVADRPAEEIIEFQRRFVQVRDSAYRNPLWGAAHLIEGGCGDDGFRDFRAGLVLQGRERFTRAVADPDSLADLPVVVRMATEDAGWLGCEDMNFAARTAYARREGEIDTFDAAVKASAEARRPEPLGAAWDFDDEAATRARLPRLAALFYDEEA
jgi:hypothetical protein